MSAIAQQFLIDLHGTDYGEITPRYNIAPQQNVLCVMQTQVGGPRQLSLLRWGLVPSWADSATIGNNMINARAETAIEKPAFRAAMKSRRCVIPADGYYEWVTQEDGKQPYEFSRADGHLLAFAGLWEQNKRIHGHDHPLFTCTILTTSANAFAARLHDRMPVLLNENDLAMWLDPGFKDTDRLRELMRPAAEDYLVTRPVSRQLNYVKNEGPELLTP